MRKKYLFNAYKHLLNKFRSIIIILILIEIVKADNSANCRQSCTVMQYEGCIVCVKICQGSNGGQNSFTFQNCTHKACNKYGQQRNLSCSIYSQAQLDQKTCLTTCCNSQQMFFTQKNLQECRQMNIQQILQSQNSKTVIVICAIGCFVIFLICCLVCHKHRLCSRIWNWLMEKFKRNNQNDPNNANQVNQQNNNNNRQINQIPIRRIQSKKRPLSSLLRSRKWIQRQKIKYQIQDQCSICLQTTTNCFTECRHLFHFQCLLTWIRKRSICPFCNSRVYNPIRLVCQICEQKQITISIDRMTPELICGEILCSMCEVKEWRRRQLEKKENQKKKTQMKKQRKIMNETSDSLNNNE